MTITAVYVRVSTYEQNEAGQKREIARWLQNNNVDMASVHWYIDKSSGDNLERPEFEQMQRDIFSGNVSTVVVWKLDRLSRSLNDGINIITEWCNRGIRVVSTSQQIDFSGTIGKMIASILFAIAEIEQQNRKERQAVGIAIAKEKGLYKGRKPGATKAGVNPKHAIKLRQRGFTQKEIAKNMGISISSVKRYLKNQPDDLTPGPATRSSLLR